MLFLNISSDKVHISDGKEEQFLERSWIENVFWPVLVQWYRKRQFDQVFVLNWPGWFTNLRVWVLAINMLNSLLGWHLKVYSCTKIQLYKYLVKKWFLPNFWLIYLGQKKNIWKADCQKDEYLQVVLSSVLDEIPAPIDKAGMTWENVFVDYLVDKEYWGNLSENMVQFSVKDDVLEIVWRDKTTVVSIGDLWLQSDYQVKAEYFIDATVN